MISQEGPLAGITLAPDTLAGPKAHIVHSAALNEVAFKDAAGNPLMDPRPLLLSVKRGAVEGEAAVNDLVELQFGINNEERVETSELSKRLGRTNKSLAGMVGRVYQVIPEDFVRLELEDGRHYLHVGSFAVSSSVEVPTDAAYEAAAARHDSARAHMLEHGRREPYEELAQAEHLKKTKEKTIKADATKAKITAYESATFKIGGETYALQLNEPTDLLTVRIMAAFKKAPREQSGGQLVFDKNDFLQYVWSDMSLAERALFTGDVHPQESIYEDMPAPIVKHAQAILAALSQASSRRPALISYDNRTQTFSMSPIPIVTKVHRHAVDPAKDPYEGKQKLFTDHAKANITSMVERSSQQEIQGARLGASAGEIVPAEPTEADRAWLEAWPRQRRLTDEEAIEALTRVMSNSGKAAIREAAGNDPAAYEAEIAYFHYRIRGALRDRYWGAWTRRQISGERATGGPRNVGLRSGRPAADAKAGKGIDHHTQGFVPFTPENG